MGYRSNIECYAEFEGAKIKKKLEAFKEENDCEGLEIGEGYFELTEYSWKMYANDVIPFFQGLADVTDFTADIRGEELRDVWQIQGEGGKLYVIDLTETKTLVDGRFEHITDYIGVVLE